MTATNPYDRARTLIQALHDPDRHSFSLIDCTDNVLVGVYADQRVAERAVLANVTPRHAHVLTVWHPSRCDCPDVAA